MTVIDHEPASWFLLAEGDALFLDASCNHGPFGYSWLIELDPGERGRFAREGRAFLARLAEDIHDSVPLLEESRSPYKARNRDRELGARVTEAVRAWRGAR
jgi:hypothetical protein